MSVVHLYQGRELDLRELARTSFKDLLDSRKDDDGRFLSFYAKGKLVREVSFAELHRETRDFIDRLSPVLRSGSRVLVLTGNSPETYFAYSALLSVGAVVIPVDPNESLTYVQKTADFADADAVIAFSEWSAKLAGADFSVIRTESSSQPDAIVLTRPARTKESATTLGPNAVATVFFTSGTTGDAKGVVQTVSSTLANAEGTKRAGMLAADDVLTSCLPLYHVNAFNFSFVLPLYLGCRIVYHSGLVPNFWSILEAERASVASLSPPILRLLLKDSRSQTAPRTLRYVISASSALHRSDLHAFRERFDVRVHQAYGLSETINFTLFTPPDLNDEEFSKVASAGELPPAGVPVWGHDVALVDEQGRVITEESKHGEVTVRGWSVLKEYLHNPQATERAFAGDRFHTGDIAYFKNVEGRRFFFLSGRLKETVKRLGQQIYLSEIDQAAREIGLEQACAVGFKNDFTEEEIGLFMVRTESETRDHETLLRELGRTLQFAKCPKVVVEGSEIPKTAVGKIRRSTLEKHFEAHAKTRFQNR